MAIFNSYVKLPEGTQNISWVYMSLALGPFASREKFV